MLQLRYPPARNWSYYLLIGAYAALIGRMTLALWFGDGINVFASYSDASSAELMLVDANAVYWSKTSFLFLTLLLVTLKLDFRFAVGVGSLFWAISLAMTFGFSTNLSLAALLGALVAGTQIIRGEVLDGAGTVG